MKVFVESKISFYIIINVTSFHFDSGLEISLLDQMKLIYESNAWSIENLILSSREHSKAFIFESSSSASTSSCSSEEEHESQDVS